MPGELDDIVVYELPRSRFTVARDLYRELWFDAAFVGAVFEGRQPGRLFVDDPERPVAALMSHAFEYYVAGSPESPAMRAFIRDAPAEVEIFASLYGYAPTNVAWSLAILSDHDGQLIMVPRRGFRWQVSDKTMSLLERWRVSTSGVAVRQIDRTVARRLKHELDEDPGHFWAGLDNYLTNSFGYCVFVNGKPASLAHVIGIGGGEANIAVFTAPEIRRQGHASRACTACIDHCVRRGLVPTWDCDSDNPRSADLARKLGFREFPPFSQISPLPGTRLVESHGLWRRSAADGDLVRWSRQQSNSGH